MIILIPLAIVLALIVSLFLLIRFSPSFKRSFGKYFYDWLYGLKWEKSEMNNYGFAPAGPDALRLGGDEPHQIQLYAELGSMIPLNEWPGLYLLEVGCGRGGGIRFLHETLQPKSATGLDFSQNAINYSKGLSGKQKQNLHYHQGDAHALPFDAGSFDVIINVESSHIYADQAKFFKEVKRVLKPGGRFIIGDYRLLGTEGMEKLHADLSAAGLTQQHAREISDNVLMACKNDSARREAMISKAPGFIKWYLRDFAMVADSREYREFKATYKYFIEVWA